MSEKVRLAILAVLREHRRVSPGSFKADVELANQLSQPVDEIQRQLEILEDHRLVTVAKAFGPSYSASITSGGLLCLEQVEEQGHVPEKPPLGFRKPN